MDYRNDHDAALARLAALEMELADERDKNSRLSWELVKARAQKFWKPLLIGATLGMAGFAFGASHVDREPPPVSFAARGVCNDNPVDLVDAIHQCGGEFFQTVVEGVLNDLERRQVEDERAFNLAMRGYALPDTLPVLGSADGGQP